jgi:hypothetical protein
MDAKPADFFIGVVEFFSILLPGALLTYLLLPLGLTVIAPVFPVPGGRAEQWIAFLIVAYVMGHGLHHVGSLLDAIYDAVYIKRYKRRVGEEKLLTQARARMRNQLHDSDLTSAFSWAGSYVRVHSAPAASELERSGADSKFFRSLAPVLVIAAVLALVRGAPVLGAILLVGAIFAFWRYCSRRWVTSQLTYEYYLLLTTVPPAEPQARH